MEAQQLFLNSLSLAGESFEDDEAVVLEIIDLGLYDDDVYDLETAAGTFQAGIGDLIVKNTDSVFVKFKIDPPADDPDLPTTNPKKWEEYRIAESFKFGKHAAKSVTDALFKWPINLDFEKVYYPLIMIGKKRYVGQLFNEKYGPGKAAYVDYKGVELKRRDNCPLVKEIYQEMINVIVSQGPMGLEAAKGYIKGVIDSLMAGEVPMEKLIITKTLKSGYKNENIPHKILAERIALRAPGSEPRINDRVPFVFVDIGNPQAKQFEIIEDPTWAAEHHLKLNALYYLEHQLRTPIVQFLGAISPEITQFIDGIISDLKGKSSRKFKLLPGQTFLSFPVVPKILGVSSASSASLPSPLASLKTFDGIGASRKPKLIQTKVTYFTKATPKPDQK